MNLGFSDRLLMFFCMAFLIFSCVRILFSVLSWRSVILWRLLRDWIVSCGVWCGNFSLLSFLMSEVGVEFILMLDFLILYIVELIRRSCLWRSVPFLLKRL